MAAGTGGTISGTGKKLKEIKKLGRGKYAWAE
jgi:cysteine synthase